jgi:tetrapyrrole methylase family protein/MazG family protein
VRNRRRIAEEFGDLLFVLVNVARFLRIDPEAALKETIRKFGSRFHYIETSLRQAGKSVRKSNLVEMDRLWEEAKRKTKREVKVKAKVEQ